MTIEEKATEYIKPYEKSISDKEIQDAKSDFKNGYKACIDDVVEFIAVNRKADTLSILHYLKSLK